MSFREVIYLTLFLSGAASAASLDTISQEAERRAQADQFSGIILIAQDGKPVLQRAYGLSDRERKTPNDLYTKFRFGSMGKMFTAVAALQLVQAGKIALNDPIGKFLPDYPKKEVAAVTIEQLLTHTGATGDFFGPDYFERRTEIRDHQDYLNLIGARGLLGTPGTRWNYSNYGMILLGRVIEVVSKQSYADYTRAHIFDPLGMRDTGNEPESASVPKLSTGYTRMGPRPGPPVPLHSNVDTLPYRGTAAGGGYTTAGDLLKFTNALESNELLDEAHTKLLLSPRIATARPGIQQALGISVQTWPDGKISVGHGGGAPGMNGELFYFPESKTLVVVLANLDPPAASEFARFIVAEGLAQADASTTK